MEYAAPNEIKGWLECLFWFAAFAAAITFIAKQFRAARAEPPNESLALSSNELTRCVSHLESENKMVWEKMERDRMEWKDALSDIKCDIGSLQKETELGNQWVSQLTLKIDRLLAR